jgi:hypothetical protein
LSSYVLLAPWLSDADVQRTFTIDFLNETSLTQLFLEMTGTEGHPPLDCVGTPEELTLSANLLARDGRYSGKELMKLARERGIVREADWDKVLQKLLQLQTDDAVPAGLRGSITDRLREQLAA